ncbi:squalene/phytoene synthase family protein [Luteimonas sp. SDU82]|uniref:squalene/phytoene synthase family protein n=3 Tax=unclassified Luteimonas TaxID=2629088 RepID=UPI003EB805D6
MNDPDSLDSFLGKWRARWPEWELLSVFVPAPQRGTVAAWYALLDELGDAAWAGTDPTPGLAKLAWWQEELLGWQRGARRHPLGQALQRLAAPWDTLGRALASLPQTRSAADADAGALKAFAAAVLACEAALFGGSGQAAAALAAVDDDLDALRALTQGGATGRGPAPGPAAGLTRPRCLHQVALRAHLRRQAAGQSQARPATFGLLLSGWRAARRG